MKKIAVLLALLLAIASLPANQEDIWSSSLEKVTNIVSLIDQNYYKSANQEQLVYASIRGALDTLDPHSYFLDPEGFSRMQEDYTAKYYGLGLQIYKYEDRLVVISPIEGTPAYRLGIMPGDVISHINGESTKPLSSYDAMQKLRGPKGTKVTITIVREGLEKPMDLTIIREEIPLYSIPYAFMLNDTTGYIYIRNFAGTTTEEFEEKMAGLVKQGMKSLILDLRGNGGGAFFQSLELSDEFLPSGAMVVSIRGRNKAYDNEFRAGRDNQYEKLPLVVLIDQGSASASEIVSGAVMDNDRGLVVGEDSWGKGLVQTMFRLESPSSNLAVALTTAKYYTPSGRSIQRDFSHLDDYYMNKATPESQREVRYTSQGRKVLGQGGITPDYKVEFLLKPLTAEIRFKGAFFSYARKFASHQTELAKKYVFPGEAATPPGAIGKIVVKRVFVVDEGVLEDFKTYLGTLKITPPADKFQEALPDIRRELEREIVSSLWSLEEGRRVFCLRDPVVLKALEVMPESAKFIEK